MTEETTEVQEVEQLTEVDSPTTSEAEREENTEAVESTGNEPEWFKGRIDKVTSQKYDALKEAETERARAEELQKQLDAINANKPKPVVEMPDEDLKYESPEEYKAKLDAYNRDIVKQTLADERQAALIADKEQAREKQEQNERQAVQEHVVNSAKAYNVDVQEVDQAAIALTQRGIPPALTDAILAHEAAAPLMAHLAKNIGDFDEVANSVNVYEMVRKLDSLSAKSLQRNISSAPEPVTGLSGLSAKEPNDFNKRFPNAQIKRA